MENRVAGLVEESADHGERGDILPVLFKLLIGVSFVHFVLFQSAHLSVVTMLLFLGAVRRVITF